MRACNHEPLVGFFVVHGNAVRHKAVAEPQIRLSHLHRLAHQPVDTT